MDWSKLKAFVEDKSNVAEKLKFILGSVENIVEKGENAGYSAFSHFPTMFSKGFYVGGGGGGGGGGFVKSRDCAVKS